MRTTYFDKGTVKKKGLFNKWCWNHWILMCLKKTYAYYIHKKTLCHAVYKNLHKNGSQT